jgi:hypothetical protein
MYSTIKNKQEYEQVLCEIQGVEHLLDMMPKENVIDRMSLKSRQASLENLVEIYNSSEEWTDLCDDNTPEVDLYNWPSHLPEVPTYWSKAKLTYWRRTSELNEEAYWLWRDRLLTRMISEHDPRIVTSVSAETYHGRKLVTHVHSIHDKMDCSCKESCEYQKEYNEQRRREGYRRVDPRDTTE